MYATIIHSYTHTHTYITDLLLMYDTVTHIDVFTFIHSYIHRHIYEYIYVYIYVYITVIYIDIFTNVYMCICVHS